MYQHKCWGNKRTYNEWGKWISCGFTSEEEIIDNFVKTINLLDKDRILLKQNSENAYQYAKQNFSIKIFNEKYKTILQNKKIIL